MTACSRSDSRTIAIPVQTAGGNLVKNKTQADGGQTTFAITAAYSTSFRKTRLDRAVGFDQAGALRQSG
jgi:hypothetical protein